MRIEIWSDVVCPWCYIGKRRLEQALRNFPHADQVEVVYRSFELDPSTPKGAGEPAAEHLGRKYGGGPAAGERMMAQTAATAAEEGLPFNYASVLRANTIDAHRLLHLALDVAGSATQGQLKERLLQAYFIDSLTVDDPEVLTALAVDVGLPKERVEQVLASDEYLAAVRTDVAEAQSLGISAVPFYVLDRKYGISGAQPTAVFGQALEQAWTDDHPVLTNVGAPSAQPCGPDGCPV